MKPADKEQRPAERTVRDCPKYDTCSIAICPLDPKWHLRAVMQGEAVCPYLRELGKPGDPVARFAGRYDALRHRCRPAAAGRDPPGRAPKVRLHPAGDRGIVRHPDDDGTGGGALGPV